MATVNFGSFQLDTRSLELRKDGRKVPLRPQPCRLLALLASQPGCLVTRDEIRHLIWPSAVFVRFDLGVNSCLKQIRRALGDTARPPAFIETLNGRGYRFLAEVTVEAGLPVRQKHRLTMVPFIHADQALQPLVDGLTSDLARLLTRDGGSSIVVVDPMILDGAATPGAALTVLRLAQVDLLLQGRVQACGDGVRITASLLATSDLTHVWADVFDSPLSRAQDAQDRLASDLAQAVAAACARVPVRRAGSPQRVREPAATPKRPLALTRRSVAS